MFMLRCSAIPMSRYPIWMATILSNIGKFKLIHVNYETVSTACAFCRRNVNEFFISLYQIEYLWKYCAMNDNNNNYYFNSISTSEHPKWIRVYIFCRILPVKKSAGKSSMEDTLSHSFLCRFSLSFRLKIAFIVGAIWIPPPPPSAENRYELHLIYWHVQNDIDSFIAPYANQQTIA